MERARSITTNTIDVLLPQLLANLLEICARRISCDFTKNADDNVSTLRSYIPLAKGLSEKDFSVQTQTSCDKARRGEARQGRSNLDSSHPGMGVRLIELE